MKINLVEIKAVYSFHGAVRCGAVRYGVVRCGTARCGDQRPTYVYKRVCRPYYAAVSRS